MHINTSVPASVYSEVLQSALAPASILQMHVYMTADLGGGHSSGLVVRAYPRVAALTHRHAYKQLMQTWSTYID